MQIHVHVVTEAHEKNTGYFFHGLLVVMIKQSFLTPTEVINLIF